MMVCTNADGSHKSAFAFLWGSPLTRDASQNSRSVPSSTPHRKVRGWTTSDSSHGSTHGTVQYAHGLVAHGCYYWTTFPATQVAQSLRCDVLVLAGEHDVGIPANGPRNNPGAKERLSHEASTRISALVIHSSANMNGSSTAQKLPQGRAGVREGHTVHVADAIRIANRAWADINNDIIVNC
eukprot:IDg11523t1